MAMALSIEILDMWPLSTPVTYIIVSLPVLYLIVHYLTTRPLHPKEPPIIAPTIPMVGHVLSMIIYGGRHIKTLGLRQIREKASPTFTLPVPGSRIYIVTSPAVAAVVQRASKALSFTPLIPDVTQRILGLDRTSADIARKHLDPAPGDPRGFLADIQDMVYAWLGPGTYLTEISEAAARELKTEVETYRSDLYSKPRGKEEVDLLEWVRHLVTVSTARYLYGPSNPISQDPALETAFWDFDHGLGGLLIGIFPSITARKAYRGREKLVAALEDYLESGTYQTGSAIIQERVRIALAHDWTLKAAARSELSFLFAGVVNATTSTFWILLQIFADADLLARVRAEIEAALVEPEAGGDGRSVLSVEALRTACPLFVAVYRECLRLNSDNNSIRLVKEPVLLADQYYLAKGAVVQIAGGAIHGDPSIWGDNVDVFDPSRFLPTQPHMGQGGKKERQIHPAAFRAFGGGKTLCPGRHFAMNEILSVVAMIVLMFDLESPEGGKIKVPRKNDAVLPVHILEPVEPVRVIIRPRDGWQRKDVSIVLSKES